MSPWLLARLRFVAAKRDMFFGYLRNVAAKTWHHVSYGTAHNAALYILRRCVCCGAVYATVYGAIYTLVSPVGGPHSLVGEIKGALAVRKAQKTGHF